MKGGAIPIGQILGVRILVHVSWFIIFGLFLVFVQFLLNSPGSPIAFRLSAPVRWIVAALVAALFFGSVIVHELAHALVARRLGMKVSEITLFIFGGAANLEQDAPNARSEAMVALAGPLSSLALAGGFFVLGAAAARADSEVIQGVAGLGLLLGGSNLLLALFNIIPGFPLDGGRVLRAVVWGVTKDFVRATRIATLIGRGFAYLLIAYGFYQVLEGDAINGLWMAFIGWFLNQAAETSYRRVAVEKLVEGISVEDVMEKDFATIGPNLTLDTLVDQHLLSGRASFYPVTMEGDLVGTIEIGQVSKVPRAEWPGTRVTDVMSRGERLVTLTAPQPLWDAVSRFEESGATAIPVVDSESGRRLLGVLTRDGVFRALRARAQLLAS